METRRMMAPVAVLPVSRPDLHLAIKFIRWVIALQRSAPSVSNYILIVVPAASVKLDEVDRLIFECSHSPPGHFHVIPQREEYERPELGYAAAANAMFRDSLEIVEREFPGSPMLWAEADTIPTRPTWMQEIADEYAACGKPFLGAFHAHGAIPHLSGNAVYPPNWRELAPSLAVLPEPRPEQGWDTLCAHETVPQMAIAKTIQQEWITPPFSEYNTDRILKKETALFHRSKDGTLIDVLANRQGISPIALEAPVAGPTSVMGVERVHAAPRVAILIVSYAKDLPFLRYCLASIKRYASGFSGVTLVVPTHEKGLYADEDFNGIKVQYFDEPTGKGMLAHQVQKCRADEWCQDADFILHLDADCMFFRKVTPADYVKDFRCLAVRESYTRIANPNRHIWRKCVETATGINPNYDYMLRHPQIHPANVYRAMREIVERWTGMPFDQYVHSGQNQFPQSFAEFPTLGTVGNHLFPSSYVYTDYDRKIDAARFGLDASESWQFIYKRATEFLVEWWSHGGIERYRADCESVMAGRIPEYWIK